MDTPCDYRQMWKRGDSLHFWIGSFCFVLFIAILFSPTIKAASTEKLSKNEKKQLVENGVSLYKNRDYPNAKNTLEQAEVLVPNNYAVPYYLGLIYLQEGQTKATISQWRRFLELSPTTEESIRIRKMLTLLVRKEAVSKAQMAVAEEMKLTGVKMHANTLAVADFLNLGDRQIGYLGKGLSAMLITDLSKIPDFQVIDRVELQSILQEISLGESGLVDSTTAPQIGKILKAKYINTGSYVDLDGEVLHFSSVIIDAGADDAFDSFEEQGKLDEFYNVEKQIACGILGMLKRECKDAPRSFHHIHTKSLPAFILFSEGLELFDQEKYDEAREKFQQALKKDPKFDLARTTLAATPLGAMLLWDTAQFVSNASAFGMSSAAAGSATAGATGISTPLLIAAGGAAAIGGGLALLGSGGGDNNGSGSSNSSSDQPYNIAGDWGGTWQDSATSDSGQVSLSINQNQTSLNGTLTFSGSTCVSTATITGSITGYTVNWDIIAGSASAQFEGTYSAPTINGRIQFSSGSCAGQICEADFHLLSGADLSW